MRECGTTRGTQGAGAEAHPEKVAPGVDQVGLKQAPHHGAHMTSSHPGETSLTNLHGAKENLRFLHVCKYVISAWCVCLVLLFGGYVSALVCLCMCVSRITKKVMEGILRNFVERWVVGQVTFLWICIIGLK